jgi:raffinose/stachyose/melibiose transport system permease protein
VIVRFFARLGSALGIYGTLTVLAILALGPTLWVMLSSFKSGTQVFSGTGVLPQPATISGYLDAFAQVNLLGDIGTTLIYALGGSLGAIVIALLAAYPLARYDFFGRNALVAGFSLALAIPAICLATPEFFIMRALGLFDNQGGMVVFYSALFFPLAFVVLRSFLASVPRELEEAARTDGAGYFRILWRIVVPVSRPAIATALVIIFVAIWDDFFFANLLTVSSNTQNVQVALATFHAQFNFNVSAQLAGSTVVMIVPILIFLVLQRQVIAGLTAGSGK